MNEKRASYSDAGVDYDTLDAFKREAMRLAVATSDLMVARGGAPVSASRGEPAFVFDFAGRHLGFVVEGLGTKAMIARAVLETTGVNRFYDVAYDTVAAIVNDLACVGALPLVVNAYFATGDSAWYEKRERSTQLLEGWQQACVDANATWGGGESPALAGLVSEDELELAGAAVGALPDGKAPLLGENVVAGDEIVLVDSTGLHANGASLARLVASRLQFGYATELPSGRAFGEALLDPAPLYSPLVQRLFERNLPVHYHSHITGHGLLKLMRPTPELTYRIEILPEVPEVLAFLVEQAGMDAAQAHCTLNMGAGWAVYCAAGAGDEVAFAAQDLGLGARVAGRVEEGPRRVILQPLELTLEGEQLRLSV
jgi:phosphoribosylformylglycinamidine cyclo-ligase